MRPLTLIFGKWDARLDLEIGGYFLRIWISAPLRRK